MLRVYHSNRLDVLEALMEFIVERERLDDPFEPEMILVQSTGMAQWLQMTLSQKFGIAANIDFPLPASFIWDMFVRVLPEIPKESAFNKAEHELETDDSAAATVGARRLYPVAALSD